MSADSPSSLLVTIKELPVVHVAYIEYKADAGQEDIHAEIGQCFQRVQNWVKAHNHDPYALLTIGVPNVIDGQLSSYECCVQVPDDVQNGSDGVAIKALPGGRYAIVSIEKVPQTIGESIGRFYQEYVPQNNLNIDGVRPTYEVYFDERMDYSVPIL